MLLICFIQLLGNYYKHMCSSSSTCGTYTLFQGKLAFMIRINKIIYIQRWAGTRSERNAFLERVPLLGTMNGERVPNSLEERFVERRSIFINIQPFSFLSKFFQFLVLNGYKYGFSSKNDIKKMFFR